MWGSQQMALTYRSSSTHVFLLQEYFTSTVSWWRVRRIFTSSFCWCRAVLLRYVSRMGAYTHVTALERKWILNMRKEGVKWEAIRRITGRGNGAIQACIVKGQPRAVKKDHKNSLKRPGVRLAVRAKGGVFTE